MAVLFLASSLALPHLTSAQGGACGLLKAADVAPLVGGAPASKPSSTGMGCSWSGATPKHKVLLLTYKNEGVPPEMAFMGARRGAQAGGNAKLSDESGIGDKAFSGQVSFGATFVVLKHGKLLQVQYWTGGPGTSKDVDALRPVVRKAVAAF